ncbi:MAG TPA: T9SS type B sorting domain-containing protein, partial [Bacteroidetes bacterium]|nr:T9SS type B sorting domain-containing protein [Bacteroidota bacterium]
LLGVTGASTYSWMPSTSLSNATAANPYAFPATNTTYIVLGTDIWGCKDTDSIFVEVLPAPIAQAWGGATICADSSIQLFASGGSSYLWSPANLFQDPTLQNPIATLSSTSDLVVTVFAANGCDNQDTVSVTVTPTPTVEAYGGGLVCLGRETTLLAIADGSIVWSTGDTMRHTHVYTDTSTYYTVVSFENDCPSKPDTVFVTIDDQLPIAAFHATPDSGWIPLTTTFYNQSQGASTYEWTFGDGHVSNEFEPVHTFADTGRFNVQLIAYNANGCPDTAYQKVIVGADFTIWVPNAFTPNGDGDNDYFNTPWIGVKEFHIMIYDRWGMLIYESYNPDFQWYGVFKGTGCQEGVYTYVIDARGYLSEKVRKAGTVTLMR